MKAHTHYAVHGGDTVFGPIDYTVIDIQGEYGVLLDENGIENRVAMALLPVETDVGIKLHYENLEYRVIK